MVEEQEPTLPQLPSVTWNSETQSFTRKRGRGQVVTEPPLSNSSDPAVFSSDDDPNLDNYEHGRHRKKKYFGSWYQQQPASGDSTFSEETRPKVKRTLERQLDSGVWMGSDVTDMEDSLELEQPAPNRLPQFSKPNKLSLAEELARQKVLDAVEDGQENVDLTSLGLEAVSNDTIAPLSGLVCIPTVTEGVPFEQRDPAVKVYLSNNPITRAPGSLFNLEFLTFLSLRSTQINELPPAIGSLKNLETLNISLNRLRYLPGELLDLMAYTAKLKNLMIFPNPSFFQPASYPEFPTLENIVQGLPPDDVKPGRPPNKFWLDDVESGRIDIEYPPSGSRGRENLVWQPLALARSPLQYINRGVVVSKFQLPKTDALPIIETEDLEAPPAPPPFTRNLSSSSSRSRVPTLLELALKSCARADQLPQLLSLLEDAYAPPHLPKIVGRVIDQAEANANSGDVPCSTCKRRIVLPAAEWVEWWTVSKMRAGPGPFLDLSYTGPTKAEQAVPFLKRACSWGCLPKAMTVGTQLPGTLRVGWE